MSPKRSVTIGHENIVAERIQEINNIIKNNTNATVKDVVSKIVHVSMAAWYNYFSKSDFRGRISKVTVNELKNFFGLPEGVFTGKGEFTDMHREIIAAKIKEKFGNAQRAKVVHKPKAVLTGKKLETKKPAKIGRPKKVKAPSEFSNVKNSRNIEPIIKELIHEIETLKDSKQLIRLADALDKLAYIALKKIDFCEALNEL